MAAAKPKVKRMMFGGAAKGTQASMQGAAKQVVASKTAPKQMQFMSDKLRGAPMQGAAKQVPAYAKPYADAPRGTPTDLINQYNAQKSRNMGTGSQAANAAAALRKLPMNPPRPGKAGPKPMTGLGDAMRGLGAANNVARGIAGSDLKRAGLMKKGGAVKKATKK